MSLPFEVVNYYPAKKPGALLGSAIVYFHPGHMTIDVTMMKAKSGHIFASLPSRSYQDKEGATKYHPLIRFDKNYEKIALRQICQAFENFCIEKGLSPTKDQQTDSVHNPHHQNQSNVDPMPEFSDEVPF